MIKALWLTSWYPNKKDPWTGDFIQRHAQAAALFNNIHVIHVEGVEQKFLVSEIDVTRKSANNLSETIILYRKRSSHFIEKIQSLSNYFRLFKQELEYYIAKNGKPDIVHVHVPMKAGILALWLKRKYKLKYIVTEHWTIYNSDTPDNYRKRSFLFRFLTQKILENASMFLPVSKELGESVQKWVMQISYTVLPNVVNTNYFFYQPASYSNFIFIHVSTMNYQKNAEAILRAFDSFFHAFPSSQIVMIGPASEPLIALAESLPCAGNIHFKGEIPYASVAQEMQKAGAFVLFSRYENLPCVVLEALCCGLPVISTKVGGISEVINESNGILIEPGNERQLVHAMINVSQNYPSYKRDNISQTALEKYSYHTVGKQVQSIYQSLLKNTSENQE